MIKPNRAKNHLTYTLEEIYQIYVEDRADWDNVINKKDWMRVAKRILYDLSILIIKENFIFHMPNRLGKIGIRKRKNSGERLRVDWKKTKETGVLSHHLNRHTDWYYFQWHWDRRTSANCVFTNKSFYAFKPTDDKKRRKVGKRGLAAWIIELSQNPYKRDYDCLEFWG